MRLVIPAITKFGWLLLTAALSAQTPAPITQSAQGPPQTTLPELATSVLPIYPPGAATTKVDGVVELRLTIGTDGHVADVRVVSSIPPLEQAAVDAVRQWQFNPSQNGSREVPVRVRFVLSPFPADPPSRSPSTTADPSGPKPWIPGDFEFVYRYRCRTGEVRLGTIDNQIVTYRGDAPETAPLTLSLDDKQRIFLALIARGFFAAPAGVTTREPSVGVRHLADGYEVTVVGQIPGSASETARLALPDSRRLRSRVSVHQLEARQFGTWRGVRWQEPVPKSDQETEGLASLGALIRDIALPKDADKKLKEAQCR